MQISESYENYLETIYFIQKQNGEVRSIDIANYLSFSKPSISVAMKKLRQNGYISVDGHGRITLEEKGLAIAEEMQHRHRLLTSWLIELGVAEDVAEEDACRMEHVLSKESFDAMVRHMEACKKP